MMKMHHHVVHWGRILGALIVTFAVISLGIVTLARGIVRGGEVIFRAALFGSVPNALPVSADRRASVSLFAVGDVMLDRDIADGIARSHDDVYPFRTILTDPRFTEPDLRLMNLEGPVTTLRQAPEKTIDFAFSPSVIKRLTLAGWNAVSQANNHSRDQGAAGAADSRANLSAAKILVFGDDVDDGDVAIATTTVNGRRIAFVGFNDTSRPIDESVAAETMAKARSEADTLVVMVHWGEEYHDRPTDRQVQLGQWFVDHGADAVLGSHPHWVQGVAIYKEKPIVYSLGNFVFDQAWSKNTTQGLAVSLLFSDTETVVGLDPIQLTRGVPSFVAGTARDARLADLANISSADLAHQIREGRLSISVTP